MYYNLQLRASASMSVQMKRKINKKETYGQIKQNKLRENKEKNMNNDIMMWKRKHVASSNTFHTKNIVLVKTNPFLLSIEKPSLDLR